MHLDNNILKEILKEVSRVTATGGKFIFDIPSEKRRKLTGYKSSSWHGGNQITAKRLKILASNEWNLTTYYGIAFFPIHRIPKFIRRYFVKIDNFIAQSIFKEYSSHLIFVLERNDKKSSSISV